MQRNNESVGKYLSGLRAMVSGSVPFVALFACDLAAGQETFPEAVEVVNGDALTATGTQYMVTGVALHVTTPAGLTTAESVALRRKMADTVLVFQLGNETSRTIATMAGLYRATYPATGLASDAAVLPLGGPDPDPYMLPVPVRFDGGSEQLTLTLKPPKSGNAVVSADKVVHCAVAVYGVRLGARLTAAVKAEAAQCGK